MPSVRLHKTSLNGINNNTTTTLSSSSDKDNDSTNLPHNPFPPLLRTPSGLAVIELQGTISLPETTVDEFNTSSTSSNSTETPVGRLVFPDYSPTNDDPEGDTKWMKRVYLYVGQYQRMTGEVKKLPVPWGVVQRRGGGGGGGGGDGDEEGDDAEGEEEELEIVEVVRHRIIFSSRPEPVGSAEARYG
ncbi:hypothetical protein FQN54_000332 [Arachnomyces sp. PD_36]|nr:hypothetical protein FQN54_000332 [Arachnomyces sp. PD_36]